MGQGHGLGLLQMGIAGHDGGQMLLSDGEQSVHEILEQILGLQNRLFHIHVSVQRHLVVAAAAGVKPLARLADALNEQFFHIHMNVLGVGFKLHLARLDVGQDIL